jgi:hypothetical protein
VDLRKVDNHTSAPGRASSQVCLKRFVVTALAVQKRLKSLLRTGNLPLFMHALGTRGRWVGFVLVRTVRLCYTSGRVSTSLVSLLCFITRHGITESLRPLTALKAISASVIWEGGPRDCPWLCCRVDNMSYGTPPRTKTPQQVEDSGAPGLSGAFSRMFAAYHHRRKRLNKLRIPAPRACLGHFRGSSPHNIINENASTS